MNPAININKCYNYSNFKVNVFSAVPPINQKKFNILIKIPNIKCKPSSGIKFLDKTRFPFVLMFIKFHQD